MGAILDALIAIGAFLGRTFPFLVRMLGWLGIPAMIAGFVNVIKANFASWFWQKAYRAIMLTALLAAYAVFLGVFWSFVSYALLSAFIATNPFSNVSAIAGSLYLVSYAFPIKFFFGTSIALIQWRLTVVHAAIIFNRTIKLMEGV